MTSPLPASERQPRDSGLAMRSVGYCESKRTLVVAPVSLRAGHKEVPSFADRDVISDNGWI